MNALTNSVTMTSREIADLVESRHDKVKQSIERLAGRGVIGLPPLGGYLDTLGRTASEYRICKRDSYVIVAQLSPEFTARLVDRWQELEAVVAAPAAQLPDFTNPIIAARAWADQVEQKLVLEHKVQDDAPKVEAYERISEAEGSLCLRDAAKNLQMQPLKFNAWLQANGWIYRRVGKGGWTAYQDKIQSGLLMHKVTPYIDSTDGESRVNEQVRVTPKGLTRLARLLDEDKPSRRLPPSPEASAGMH